MYHSDTDLLFPMRVAPELRDLREESWREQVDRACQSPDASIEQLSFSLLLVRLSGCMTCHPSSYRAMRGCTTCAKQAVRRFRGAPEELSGMLEDARVEILDYLENGKEKSSYDDIRKVKGENGKG